MRESESILVGKEISYHQGVEGLYSPHLLEDPFSCLFLVKEISVGGWFCCFYFGFQTSINDQEKISIICIQEILPFLHIKKNFQIRVIEQKEDQEEERNGLTFYVSDHFYSSFSPPPTTFISRSISQSLRSCQQDPCFNTIGVMVDYKSKISLKLLKFDLFSIDGSVGTLPFLEKLLDQYPFIFLQLFKLKNTKILLRICYFSHPSISQANEKLRPYIEGIMEEFCQNFVALPTSDIIFEKKGNEEIHSFFF